MCPLTGAALCEGGEEREGSVHNLQEYVHLLSQLWLADGVLAQAEAFRSGIEEVFAVATLAPSEHDLAERSRPTSQGLL